MFLCVLLAALLREGLEVVRQLLGTSEGYGVVITGTNASDTSMTLESCQAVLLSASDEIFLGFVRLAVLQ